MKVDAAVMASATSEKIMLNHIVKKSLAIARPSHHIVD
jgi:hypothetical protein